MRLSRAISANIIEVVYGMRVSDESNMYLAASRKEVEIFSEVVTPGRYVVELFPALARLPSWFPGAQFKKDAEKWRPNVNFAQTLLYGTVERGMVGHNAIDSS